MYIFIDESGDLGITPPSPSPYFVIAAILSNNENNLNRCISRVRKKLSQKKQHIPSELKHSNTNNDTRIRVLKSIISQDISIAACVLKKNEGERSNILYFQELYRELILKLLCEIVSMYPREREFSIFIDKGLYGHSREIFDDLVVRTLTEVRLNSFGEQIDVLIYHVDSQGSEAIQASDFVAGTIHRYYRFGGVESEAYSLIENAIVKIIERKMNLQNQK